MTITTKFDVGDLFYHIYRRRSVGPTNIKCPACSDGYAKLPDGTLTKCNSSFDHGKFSCRDGELYICEYKWFPETYVARCDTIEFYCDGDAIITYRDCDNGPYDEEDCFRTREEAQAECDRRNNGIP